jgi:FkbM family methyltransferase
MMRIATLGRRSLRAPPSTPPAPLDVHDYEQVPTELGPVWFDRRDEVMRPYVKHRRAWEESEGAILGNLITTGTRFLDVGANVGYFSLFAARAAARVRIDAVEPHPGSAAALRWNLWVNHVPATIHQLALDDRRRHLTLDVSPANIGDARLSARAASDVSITVDTVPADELFAGRSFDVVKIDVQGWETEVVRGMRQIIARSPQIALLVEFWPAALRERDVEPFETLAAYHALNLDVVTQVDTTLRRLGDEEIVEICNNAGPYGQVNLLLRRR